jgi:DNA-binding NarL/FixJ family response regulator
MYEGDEEAMYQDRVSRTLLWLYHAIDLKDLTDWGRALLAWKYELSREEMQVVELIAAGYKNEEIRAQLGLADENTVKGRIKSIFSKMHVGNRVRVAVIAVQFGLSVPDEDSPRSSE